MHNFLVIAGSAGSISVSKILLSSLPKQLNYSVGVVIHQKESCKLSMVDTLKSSTEHPVVDPQDGERVELGHIYVAPSLYHLQVEPNHTFSFALDAPVKFSRPSIDVFLQTAAWVYKENLMVILLSGSSSDGAMGCKKVLEYGGKVCIQNPLEAEVDIMPKKAMDVCDLEKTYTTDELKKILKYWRK